MEWTEETISHLRALWQEGLSTAEIGRRLSVTKNAVVGKAHRLVLPARPSPIRKSSEMRAGIAPPSRREAHRPVRPASAEKPARVTPLHPRPTLQGSQGRSGADQRDPATVTPLRVVPPRPAAPVSMAQDTIRGDAGAKDLGPSLGGRRGLTCCWPLGDPGTRQFRFCGAEPLLGKPYCSEHAQLAYVKLRDRRDTVA